MVAPKICQMPFTKPIFLQIIPCSLAPGARPPQVHIMAYSPVQYASNEIKKEKICWEDSELSPFKDCPHFPLFRFHSKTCFPEEESSFSYHQPNLLVRRNRMVYKMLYLLSIFTYIPQFSQNTHFVWILQGEN